MSRFTPYYKGKSKNASTSRDKCVVYTDAERILQSEERFIRMYGKSTFDEVQGIKSPEDFQKYWRKSILKSPLEALATRELGKGY